MLLLRFLGEKLEKTGRELSLWLSNGKNGDECDGIGAAEVAGRGKVIALEWRKRKWVGEKDLGVFGGVTGVHPPKLE